VKPRRIGYTHLPIIALGDSILTERGEVFSLAELPRLIASEPRSILVGPHMGRTVQWLDDELDDNPRWQFRLNPVKREMWSCSRQRQIGVLHQSVCTFLGFQRKNGHDQNHYHYPLDPQWFCRYSIYELMPGPEPVEMKLMDWAKDVRSFLKENDIPVKPTSGGVAGALLRDTRFYPEPRRKVPRATNDRIRPQLPGNFYRLYAGAVGERYDAYYLDQSSAHHRAARRIAFPCANGIVARGHFRNVSEDGTPADKPWLRAGTLAFERVINRHRGIFFVKLYLPPELPHIFAPPCMDYPLHWTGKGGTRTAWVYSNELDYIRECGGDIRYIIAAWTSTETERGLNAYAGWSLDQLDNAAEARKRWMKTTLLSTYGILATTPKEVEFAFKRAKGGDDKLYPLGTGRVPVKAKTLAGEREVPIANVIHRGMVEAETRLSCLTLATDLHAQGLTILGVYADSVFVLADKPLPLLPSPWRLQEQLTGLEFLSATSFTSRQLTKLPGVSGEAREKLSRRRRTNVQKSRCHG
jgi:hypothetical protein